MSLRRNRLDCQAAPVYIGVTQGVPTMTTSTHQSVVLLTCLSLIDPPSRWGWPAKSQTPVCHLHCLSRKVQPAPPSSPSVTTLSTTMSLSSRCPDRLQPLLVPLYTTWATFHCL